MPVATRYAERVTVYVVRAYADGIPFERRFTFETREEAVACLTRWDAAFAGSPHGARIEEVVRFVTVS